MKSSKFGTPARRHAIGRLSATLTPHPIDPRLAPPRPTPTPPAPTFWLARLLRRRNRP